MSNKKVFSIFVAIIVAITLIFSFSLFGVTGARVALGIVFVSFPFYLMLNRLEINESEKIVFSILLGLTIFPTLVYLAGLLVPFKIAIVLAFLVLITPALVLIKYKNF